MAEGGECRHTDYNNSSTIRIVNQKSVTQFREIPLIC